MSNSLAELWIQFSYLRIFDLAEATVSSSLSFSRCLPAFHCQNHLASCQVARLQTLQEIRVSSSSRQCSRAWDPGSPWRCRERSLLAPCDWSLCSIAWPLPCPAHDSRGTHRAESIALPAKAWVFFATLAKKTHRAERTNASTPSWRASPGLCPLLESPF